MSLNLNPKMFRGFSIRGVVGRDLDAETMRAIGQGVGPWFARRGGNLLAAGSDVRESSPALQAALVRGILDAGVDVVDVGCVPTPLLNFATDHYQASGGVMVTASHNPREYNGLKIAPHPDSIAWGLGTLLSDFDRARWMGENGRREVGQHFTWDVIAARTSGTYRHLRDGTSRSFAAVRF